MKYSPARCLVLKTPAQLWFLCMDNLQRRSSFAPSRHFLSAVTVFADEARSQQEWSAAGWPFMSLLALPRGITRAGWGHSKAGRCYKGARLTLVSPYTAWPSLLSRLLPHPPAAPPSDRVFILLSVLEHGVLSEFLDDTVFAFHDTYSLSCSVADQNDTFMK